MLTHFLCLKSKLRNIFANCVIVMISLAKPSVNHLYLYQTHQRFPSTVISAPSSYFSYFFSFVILRVVIVSFTNTIQTFLSGLLYFSFETSSLSFREKKKTELIRLHEDWQTSLCGKFDAVNQKIFLLDRKFCLFSNRPFAQFIWMCW